MTQKSIEKLAVELGRKPTQKDITDEVYYRLYKRKGVQAVRARMSADVAKATLSPKYVNLEIAKGK